MIKIDTDKLSGYITQLNGIRMMDTGKRITDLNMSSADSSGDTVTQIADLLTQMQNLQDALNALIMNTVSYLTERKTSVNTKDAEAAEVISGH